MEPLVYSVKQRVIVIGKLPPGIYVDRSQNWICPGCHGYILRWRAHPSPCARSCRCCPPSGIPKPRQVAA